MTFALYRQAGVSGASIVGADFAHPCFAAPPEKARGFRCSGLRLMLCECPLPIVDSISSPQLSVSVTLQTTMQAFVRSTAYSLPVARSQFLILANLVAARQILRFLFPPCPTCHRIRAFRNPRPLCLSARKRCALSAAARDALAHEERWLPRGQLHAVYLWRSWCVLGQEVIRASLWLLSFSLAELSIRAHRCSTPSGIWPRQNPATKMPPPLLASPFCHDKLIIWLAQRSTLN